MGYFKARPNEYVMQYVAGKVKREGAGLSFFYTKWASSLLLVPLSTQDTHFAFNENTGNFQEVTVQGMLTYRIIDAPRLAKMLDYTIHPRTRDYLSEDPDKLSERLLNMVQKSTRGKMSEKKLEDALRSSKQIAEAVFAEVMGEPALADLGVALVGLHFSALTPTPTMSKALEAEYREALQKRADEAIYSRRAAAVEQERKISQNELINKIALEDQRSSLVALEGQNSREEAQFEADAKEILLKPYREIGSQTIMALALKEMGENAGRIGNLTITPELMAAIAGAKDM